MSEWFEWNSLANPILRHEQWSLKDPCMCFDGGWFYVFCSAFYDDDRSRLLGLRTRDFKDFERLFLWGDGREGWCSPNLTRRDETWVLTYQSWDGRAMYHPQESKALFYATSSDLQNWDTHHPLAAGLTRGVRSIDPVIAFAGDDVYLLWKYRQTPQMATAKALDSQKWTLLGEPFEYWLENGQFLQLEGRWRLWGTSDGRTEPNSNSKSVRHPQYLVSMAGRGDRNADWMDWGPWLRQRFPTQAGFNEHECANAGFLADWRQRDGHYYAIFCARTDGAGEKNMGFTLGLSRSTDLANWQFPG